MECTEKPPDMACYRKDIELPNLNSELEEMLIPSPYFNMVEQLTSLEDDVLQRAGEKIVAEDNNVTSWEFFYIGVFRKSNLFYGFLALINFYWLSYGFLAFKYSREGFDKFITMYREFYMKSLLLIVYAVFLIFMIYNSFYTAQWVEYYKNRNHGRQERFEKFLEEYEGVVNSTSLRSSCSMEEARTEWDEIEAFHLRIQEHYQENIPTSEKTLSIMLNVSELVQRDCRNETDPICGNQNGEQQIKNWTVVENLKAWNSPDLPSNWDNLTEPFENAKTEVFNQQRTSFQDIREAARERMMLLKNVYIKVEALFSSPSPYYIVASFYALHFVNICIVAVSLLSILAMFRDRSYLENNGMIVPLVKGLRKINCYIFIFAFYALFWSWLVVIFSSAAHSLYLVVLRDFDFEVLGKLNVTDSNGHQHFNFREFLKSTDHTVIEELLALNPQAILRNNTHSRGQIHDWKHKIEIILENNTSLYKSPVKEFCENTGQLFNENNGSWIDKLRKELHQITRLCKSIEGECFFCKFKEDLNKTSEEAMRIRERNVAVANRSGNDLEGLLILHQKYRLGMWNDYVAPITFLEVPSSR
ncbi:hypothetical protein B9Z55_019934 [Caenorhabditis nigoni]|uniref:Uncharacterized protein n=1 Tax=Caenorhabditis nigoni TaxID=1611254 RepID=A0A2G5TKM4_9PELO|nr:hypothetical protein B9Z55_019934 [Caenorhabditis nigoni]